MRKGLPRSVEERGNLTLYVGSANRKRKLQRLLEITRASSVSAAVYQAIDFFLQAHESTHRPDHRGSLTTLTEE